MTVSVVLPASPFWEMKARVRMQEAWGCVKRAMRVLRFQVTSWGERADWGGVPGRGVELGRLGSPFSGLYRGRPWRDVDRRQQESGDACSTRCGAEVRLAAPARLLWSARRPGGRGRGRGRGRGLGSAKSWVQAVFVLVDGPNRFREKRGEISAAVRRTVKPIGPA